MDTNCDGINIYIGGATRGRCGWMMFVSLMLGKGQERCEVFCSLHVGRGFIGWCFSLHVDRMWDASGGFLLHELGDFLLYFYGG